MSSLEEEYTNADWTLLSLLLLQKLQMHFFILVIYYQQFPCVLVKA